MTEYVFVTKESRRTAYSRRKDEREAKAKEAELFLQSLDAGLEPPPANLSAGRESCEEVLTVEDGCAGLILGRKGENVRSLQERHKVKISLSEVRDGSQTLKVSGGSQAVAAAVRDLDYVSDKIDVPAEQSRWLVGKGGCHIEMIREFSGVATAKLRRSGTGDSETAVWLELKGLRETVENAKLCAEAHLSYHPVFAEMDSVEQDLDQQLEQLQARLGRRAPAPRRATGAAPSAERRRAGRGAELAGKGATGSRARGESAESEQDPEAVSSLMKRTPGLDEASARRALTEAEGHVGRAARNLRLAALESAESP